MRTALLTLLALAVVPPPPADACGPYAPRILQVSTHAGRGDVRSFVVLGDAAEAPRTWRDLAPGTYDPARIADGQRLAHPMTFTVVGGDGTKVVAGSRQVFLSGTFAFTGSASAIEVPALTDHALAIEGAHPDAVWRAFDDAAATTPAIRAWVAARLPEADSVSVLRRGDLEVVTAYDRTKAQRISFVRRGDAELGRRAGWATGIVEVDGAQLVAFRDGARTSSLAI